MPEESPSLWDCSLIRCGERRIAFSAGCFVKPGSLHGAVAGVAGAVGSDEGSHLGLPSETTATLTCPDAGAWLWRAPWRVAGEPRTHARGAGALPRRGRG